MMQLRTKDWDSAFFGYPVASLELHSPATTWAEVASSIREASCRNIRLLYLFLSPVDDVVRSALQENVRYVGRKVDYVKDVPSSISMVPDPEIVPCRSFSVALERLALQSGEFSRFRLDRGFHQQEFERLYHEWLTSSIANMDEKCVFIAGDESHPKGMITLERSDILRIGLFAVDPMQQRQGIGRKLMKRAEHFCTQHHVKKLYVATQADNRKACLFYESWGFKINNETDVFHVWLPSKQFE